MYNTGSQRQFRSIDDIRIVKNCDMYLHKGLISHERLISGRKLEQV